MRWIIVGCLFMWSNALLGNGNEQHEPKVELSDPTGIFETDEEQVATPDRILEKRKFL